MADYYPLLSRAVAGLASNTAETRAFIYDRARQALSAQLRSIDPPIAEALIGREQSALEEVIRRIERDAAGDPRLMAPADAISGDPAAEPTIAISPAGPKRPKAPARAKDKADRKPWMALILGIGVSMVIGVAVLAVVLRDAPETPAPVRREAGTTPPNSQPAGQKIGDRVGSEGTTPTTAQPTPPAQTPGTSPALPVAHRVFMLEEVGTAEQPQVQTRQGSIVWRLDSDSQQGQALQPVIRASIDIPEGRTRADIIIRRNADPSFAASHTIELTFQQLPGNSAGALKEVDQIEMRVADTTPGTPLAGLGIPVQDNVFLVGLSAGEPALSRNIDLLRTRGWIFFRVRFANNRLGAFLIEKGATGTRVFEEAFSRW